MDRFFSDEPLFQMVCYTPSSDIGHITLNTFLLDLLSSEHFDKRNFPMIFITTVLSHDGRLQIYK